MTGQWWKVTFVFDYATMTTTVETYEDRAEDAARWLIVYSTLIPKEILETANEVIIEEA